MTSGDPHRPDPDHLLDSLRRDEERGKHGRLKVFLGMCAGVGKTYDMLMAAREAQSKGGSVLVGYVETHGRKETEALLDGLEILPRKSIEYRGRLIGEMDVDEILRRRPGLVLVDELAHTNAPESRHLRRHQDVTELLDAGIDVYTTLNIQHLESRADTVAQITGIVIRETIPDSILERADAVEIVDLPPEELLKRLAEGKVYAPERSREAVRHFFRTSNLTALREMALRLVAERVDHQLQDMMKGRQSEGAVKSGQRILVGISASPNTVKLIRWARRTAYAMDAPWIAVYVERSRTLSPAERERLDANIKLARELGAEIVTTADDNVVEGLLRVARDRRVTQLLVGKPTGKAHIGQSLLDKLIERSGDLDIYVVGGTGSVRAFPGRDWLPEIRSGLKQYLIAATVTIAVAVALYPLQDMLGYQSVSLFLLFAVVLLPLKLDAGPVLLAAALSAVLWNFFFIPPTFTFAIGLLQDVLMFGLYFCVAAVTGVLTAKIRAREKNLRLREQHATALFALTKELSRARTQDDVARAAVESIRQTFSADTAVLLSQSDGDIFTEAHAASSFAVDQKEFGVAAWVYWNEHKAGRFTDTLPSALATYHPLSGPRYPLGVIGVHVQSGEPFTIDQDALFQAFLGQISSAFEREQLHDLTRKTLVVAESERLYRTLFDTLSHEFRTPVAAIMGATDQLDNHADEEGGRVREIVREIREGADRLNTLVQNLLDMTRLESGLLKLRKSWCDVADLVGTAVRKLEEVLHNHEVRISVAESLPLIQADQGLLEQALVNIIRNAVIHAEGATRIIVDARVEGNECVLSVADNGKGIPAGEVDRVFQKFFRGKDTRAGGTGLGLSISQGIVLAHGGAISCANRAEGGVQFTIRLPLGSPPPTVQLT
ncbi:MAG: sensor histidine kinase KdpD [Ignavibacteriae bacterium]|nr:sensor histidine kinase KdpD [Ignavibacteriota bacterium]